MTSANVRSVLRKYHNPLTSSNVTQVMGQVTLGKILDDLNGSKGVRRGGLPPC
jgi:hypothetical protein